MFGLLILGYHLWYIFLQYKEVLGKGAFKKVYPILINIVLNFQFWLQFYAFTVFEYR